jgi:hypothetical protein
MRGHWILLRLSILLVLVSSVSTACTFETVDLAKVRWALARMPGDPPPVEVAFRSYHGKYVTALGADDNWVLKQESDLSPCAWFTLQRLENGNMTLMTCHGRYVMAPDAGESTVDWLLRQSPREEPCAEFLLEDLGHSIVALRTCAGRLVTAGDGGWSGELQWSLVAEATNIDDWEKFAVLQRYAPPPVIADFDICIAVTNGSEPIGEVYDPALNNELDLTPVREEGHGCVAKAEYNMQGATGVWLQLGKIDLSPYSQLFFDIKVNSEEHAPAEYWVELKRVDPQESSTAPLTGVTADWQTLSVNLSDFQGSLSSMADMEELVFMFGSEDDRRTGTVYLDNIVLRQD